jgi:hypothetical protein
VSALTFDVGVLLYTYDRTDDARISQEFVRTAWAQSGCFGAIRIVHAYNGEPGWYPEPYLEDELLRLENAGHFRGAAELIDAGMATHLAGPSSIDYVVVLAADTWLLDPDYVASVLRRLRGAGARLATCAWGTPKRDDLFEVGMAVDFSVVDLPWVRERQMFPIDYAGFMERYDDLFLYDGGRNVKLEKLVLARFLRAVRDEPTGDRALRRAGLAALCRLVEREPVHTDRGGLWRRTHYWPRLGLTSHHDPEEKRAILRKRGIHGGAAVQKLLASQDLSYYNGNRARRA